MAASTTIIHSSSTSPGSSHLSTASISTATIPLVGTSDVAVSTFTASTTSTTTNGFDGSNTNSIPPSIANRSSGSEVNNSTENNHKIDISSDAISKDQYLDKISNIKNSCTEEDKDCKGPTLSLSTQSSKQPNNNRHHHNIHFTPPPSSVAEEGDDNSTIIDDDDVEMENDAWNDIDDNNKKHQQQQDGFNSEDSIDIDDDAKINMDEVVNSNHNNNSKLPPTPPVTIINSPDFHDDEHHDHHHVKSNNQINNLSAISSRDTFNKTTNTNNIVNSEPIKSKFDNKLIDDQHNDNNVAFDLSFSTISNSNLNTSSTTTVPIKKIPTGRLEKITARLAKKQSDEKVNFELNIIVSLTNNFCIRFQPIY